MLDGLFYTLVMGALGMTDLACSLGFSLPPRSSLRVLPSLSLLFLAHGLGCDGPWCLGMVIAAGLGLVDSLTGLVMGLTVGEMGALMALVRLCSGAWSSTRSPQLMS